MSRCRRPALVLPLMGALLWTVASTAPVTAQEAAPAERSPVETLVLSPDPGERIDQSDVLVAASFVDPEARLDPGSVVLRIDGRNVTPEADVESGLVTWTPGQPLPPGPHRITLEAAERDGEAIPPSSWTFTVRSTAEAAPAAAEEGQEGAGVPIWSRIQGSATFEGSALSTSGPGAELRRDEAAVPRLWLNAGGLLGGGWRYSARVHLSGYESSDRQPVNRYRFEVRSDHLDATVGDMNPVLHGLILGGTRVRGVRADASGGPARLSVVWGESRRGIDGAVDPTDPERVERRGTYARDIFAVRPAVGGDKLQVGVTFLRAKDDVSSIPELRTGDGDPEGGATARVNPLPKENVVAGTDATLRLLDGRILVQYENAFSLLANDITSGAVSEEELDEILRAAGHDPLGLDPSGFEDFFTINASMIPLDPRGLTSLAQELRTSLRTGRNMLSVEWHSIGGSYYSLGHPALQRDRRGFRIRDSFSLLDDDLALSAGLERDEDNLDDIKPATTTRTGVFGSASWQASPRAPTITASVRRWSRENDLPVDRSGARQEESVALSFGASYPVEVVPGLRTRLNLNLSSIDREDPATPSSETRDRYYLGGVDGETTNGDSRFSVMYGLNTTELLGFEGATTDFHRITADVRQRLRPRWTATLDGSLMIARSPEEAGDLGLEYDRHEFLLGGEYEWTAASFVTLTAGFVRYSDALFPDRDTRELVTRLRVHRAF